MQPFEIVDRKTGAFVRTYMANNRQDAIEQHCAGVGAIDSSVKAKGPAERGPKPFVKRIGEAENETPERNMMPVRLQRRGANGSRVTSISARGRKPGKHRLKLAKRRSA